MSLAQRRFELLWLLVFLTAHGHQFLLSKFCVSTRGATYVEKRRKYKHLNFTEPQEQCHAPSSCDRTMTTVRSQSDALGSVLQSRNHYARCSNSMTNSVICSRVCNGSDAGDQDHLGGVDDGGVPTLVGTAGGRPVAPHLAGWCRCVWSVPDCGGLVPCPHGRRTRAQHRSYEMYGELVWGRVVVLRNTRRGNHHSGAPTERAPPSHACNEGVGGPARPQPPPMPRTAPPWGRPRCSGRCCSVATARAPSRAPSS
jgi:hypothetical protein